MRKKPLTVLLTGWVLVSLVGSLAGCATSGAVVVEDDSGRVEVVFTDRDRRLIQEYYSSRRPLPPGLAKRSSLPPGLQRQIQRRGELPPGLQGEQLPDELEVHLSRLPEGYVRVRVGADVVLMNTRTRIIVDVIKDLAI